MNVAGRAGLAGAALLATAAGAAAGVAAERVLVGRPVRRRPGIGRLGLGQLRGDHVLVTADDGVQLYVEVDEPRARGRWSDLTVVFVHGYALNQDSFHFQRAALRGQARLVFYDHRSHGRSGRGPSSGATIGQLGRDLMAVLHAVAPDGPVVLVGHSMGGMTVMALAEEYPALFGDRVVGAALMSTTAGELSEVTLGIPAAVTRMARRLAPTLVTVLGRNPMLVERGRQVSTDLAVLVARFYGFASEVPAEVVEFSLEMINATPLDVLADFYPSLDGHEAMDALGVLNQVETLVLVGSQDLLTPPEHSRRMLRAVPGAELVELDPGGHLVILEHPDDVNGHLFDLFDRAARLARSAAPA
ncbi:MAG: alpha/beta hydrolase [Actinomycetota bacterium]|nr:alpha/beta hydrolase [Actinomycetota bacterium]